MVLSPAFKAFWIMSLLHFKSGWLSCILSQELLSSVKTRHTSRLVGEFKSALKRSHSNVRRTHDLGSFHSQKKAFLEEMSVHLNIWRMEDRLLTKPELMVS